MYQAEEADVHAVIAIAAVVERSLNTLAVDKYNANTISVRRNG
jgi:hypothetical protein